MDHETCPDARRDTPVELEGSRVPWDPPGGLGAGGKAERVTYSFGSSSDRHSRRAAPKSFCACFGWRLDRPPPAAVQFTPHGSACSVQFGPTLTLAAPDSGKGYLVVSDVEAPRNALAAAGVDVSEVFHVGPGGPVPCPDPERRSYFSRPTFSDPDGNFWLLQILGAVMTAYGLYVLYLMLRRPEDLAVEENHVSWAHMYRMMFVAQIGFALAYLF